jgi:hypothetical protein
MIDLLDEEWYFSHFKIVCFMQLTQLWTVKIIQISLTHTHTHAHAFDGMDMKQSGKFNIREINGKWNFFGGSDTCISNEVERFKNNLVRELKSTQRLNFNFDFYFKKSKILINPCKYSNAFYNQVHVVDSQHTLNLIDREINFI